MQALLLTRNWAGSFWNRAMSVLFFVLGLVIIVFGYNIAYLSFLGSAPSIILPGSSSIAVSLGEALANAFLLSVVLSWFANSISAIVMGSLEAAAASIVLCIALTDQTRTEQARRLGGLMNAEKERIELQHDFDQFPVAGVVFDDRMFEEGIPFSPSAPPFETEPAFPFPLFFDPFLPQATPV
jgi:hypothetical protein